MATDRTHADKMHGSQDTCIFSKAADMTPVRNGRIPKINSIALIRYFEEVELKQMLEYSSGHSLREEPGLAYNHVTISSEHSRQLARPATTNTSV